MKAVGKLQKIWEDVFILCFYSRLYNSHPEVFFGFNFSGLLRKKKVLVSPGTHFCYIKSREIEDKEGGEEE